MLVVSETFFLVVSLKPLHLVFLQFRIMVPVQVSVMLITSGEAVFEVYVSLFIQHTCLRPATTQSLKGQ